MTPAHADTLRTLELAMAGLGVVETLMAVWYARSNGPQKNLSHLFFFAGPGFLLGAVILNWAWDYIQSLTVAVVIAAVGCTVGALRMARAAKESVEGGLQ